MRKNDNQNLGVVSSPPAMTLRSRGFLNVRQRSLHWGAHGDDFKAGTPDEYEHLADEFLTKTLAAGMQEHIRSRGDKIRYDPRTEEFGIMDVGGVIRTYFIPVPCSSLPATERVLAKRRGLCHDCVNNLIYFKRECKRW